MNQIPSPPIADVVEALTLIADIAEGSTTANSLPHIAKLARAALSARTVGLTKQRHDRQVLVLTLALLVTAFALIIVLLVFAPGLMDCRVPL